MVLFFGRSLDVSSIKARSLCRRKWPRYSAGCTTINIVQEYMVIMPTTHITLTGSQAGMINTGSLEEIESIDVTITALQRSAEEAARKVARAFTELAEAVANNHEFENERHREELLQQIDLLAHQAALAEDKRQPGLIKGMLSAVGNTCSSAGGLAAVWSIWGPQIVSFFAL